MVNGTFTCVIGGVKGHASSAYMQRKKEKDKCKKEKERSHLIFCIQYTCVLLKHTHRHHHDPTCVSSTGAVVRGGLAFGHAVLSGVVQVGDNCREVSVTTATHKIHTQTHIEEREHD